MKKEFFNGESKAGRELTGVLRLGNLDCYDNTSIGRATSPLARRCFEGLSVLALPL